jgi:multidrug resistance efflux pump
MALSGRWQQPKADSQKGTLLAKSTSITAGRAAKLAEILAPAGTDVVPGTPLLRLVDDQLTARIATKQKEIEGRAVELQKVQAQADVEFQWRQQELKAEVFQTQLKSASFLKEKINHQVEQLAWKEQLTTVSLQSGSDSLTDTLIRPLSLVNEPPNPVRLQALLREDAAASAVEALNVQIGLCETRMAELKQLEEALTLKIRTSVGVELAETRLKQSREELTTLEAQTAGLTIISETYGRVGLWNKQIGDAVHAGEAIVELHDQEQRFLALNVPSTIAGEYRPGVKLSLIFPGQERLAGTVDDVGPQTLRNSEEPVVPVRITSIGRVWPELAIGTRVIVEPPR